MSRVEDGCAEFESPIVAIYCRRSQQFAEKAQQLRQWMTVARSVRWGLVVGAVACVALATASSAETWLLGLAVGLSLAWLAMTAGDERLRRQWRYNIALGQLNEQSCCRIRRDWNGISLYQTEVPAASRGLADDLDLFGRGSLFHLVCQATTQFGVRTLGDWLLRPATNTESLIRRQNAVRALAGDIELRQELAARGQLTGQPSSAALVDWAERGESVNGSRVWRLWRMVYPVLLVASCYLLICGIGSAEILGSAIALLLAVNLLATAIWTANIHMLLRRLFGQNVLTQYSMMFRLLNESLVRHQDVEKAIPNADAGSAGSAIRQLGRLLALGRLLRLPIIWLPVQIITLWDFHVYSALEGWRRRHGRQIRRWLESLGQLEAISSLAALAHDNPGWCFPTFQQDEQGELASKSLAHPLQSAAKRVANDVTLGPGGTVLFVTGSNMSGKSTLLRAIGANVVLAQAGGPVCAASLTMPRVVLATTMRVQDSLALGTSLFMAELLRLREVLVTARKQRAARSTRVLFLLDEILHGTNTAERRIACRSVLLELCSLGAMGGVSTHDLDLPRDANLEGISNNVHFSEQIDDGSGTPRMRFDYRLRPGIATGTNALQLLELMGIRPR